jgi:phenylalanine ammonia-lyase
MASTSMPESWVRAAILIRMNSLIRGHSGVRWEFISALGELLRENVIPVVPLRGSISASGGMQINSLAPIPRLMSRSTLDLSPLSYVAGTLIGNPAIRVFDGPVTFGPRRMVPAVKAFKDHGLKHVVFEAKEHLGLLNGTAFSAGLATLALNDAAHVALLAQVCTAMGTEALLGTQGQILYSTLFLVILTPSVGSFDPFIHDVARPHRGQIEVAKNIFDLLQGSSFAVLGEEKELSIKEDVGKLRQDRYALRTAPQFLGPQLETILSALAAVTQECNSSKFDSWIRYAQRC